MPTRLPGAPRTTVPDQHRCPELKPPPPLSHPSVNRPMCGSPSTWSPTCCRTPRSPTSPATGSPLQHWPRSPTACNGATGRTPPSSSIGWPGEGSPPHGHSHQRGDTLRRDLERLDPIDGTVNFLSQTSTLAEALISIDQFAFGEDAERKNRWRLRLTERLAHDTQRVRMLGSSAIDLAWTAEGRLDTSMGSCSSVTTRRGPGPGQARQKLHRP